MCQRCFKAFTLSFFSLSYRDRTPPTYEEIYALRLRGSSFREMTKPLKCSLNTVLRRYREMSRQGLLIQAMKTEKLEINESIAYDGIENFSFSQYDPNNINHAIGRESLFVYDFNFAPMNRKGKESPRQTKRKKLLENEFGKYPPNAFERSTRRVLERLLSRTKGELTLHSDNHYAYRRAIRTLPFIDQRRLTHLITPGIVARNYRNRLFAINHLDMLTRHHLCSFKRETIAFSKHSIAMIEDFTLLMVQKNFMRPMFTKKQKRNEFSNKHSPAMRLGLEKRILKFHEFFSVRVTRAQVKLSEDWAQFVDKVDPTSRRTIAAYGGN